MHLSLLQILLAMGVVGLGAAIQGTIGFGMAIVSAPLLYWVDPVLMPGSLILAAMLIGLLTVRRYASEIDLSILWPALLGRVPGSIIGVSILSLFSAKQLGLLLGGAVLLAVAASLFTHKLKTTPLTLFGAGLCSGIMGTSVTIGGPPMALVLQNESGSRIRANLPLFFTIGSFTSLLLLACNGFLTGAQLGYGVCLVPAVLFGHWLACKLAAKVEKERIRQLMLVLCSISGLGTIITAL